jgi:hypothetical protein
LALYDFLANVGEVPHNPIKLGKGELDFFIREAGAAQRGEFYLLARAQFKEIPYEDSGKVGVVAGILTKEVDRG